ncbi:MAG: aminotransferase class IV [Bacteroidales bacterium]|nr:aminotransferase class IV [Bacteroidales bacterium]
MISLHKSSKYFWKNGEFLRGDTLVDLTLNESPVYEVIRYNGKFLFFEEHLHRLRMSLDRLDSEPKSIYLPSQVDMKELFVKNNFLEGNVRMDVFPKAGITVAYLVPFFYPSENFYHEGVKVVLQFDERKNQQIKQFQEDIKRNTAEILAKTGAFETLLVNKEGLITEGSKSNVFFIKEGKIYTSPEQVILAGITRKMVIKVLENMGLTIFFQTIDTKAITGFEAVFLSGTSIGVLPVKSIENNHYNSQNQLVKEIRERYNKLSEI